VSNANGGVPGVCVQALVSGTVVAGAATDASGNYSASVAASGQMFMICAVVPTGSTQVSPGGPGWPLCPSGLAGYQFAVSAGGGAAAVNFTLQ
jgi:hypothetical protein